MRKIYASLDQLVPGGLAATSRRWLASLQTALTYALIAFVLFHIILACAVLVYSLFYYIYVPVPLHSYPIYFDYATARPSTHFPLSPSLQPLLQHNQLYSVKILLQLPENPGNVDSGVFMVDLLLSSSQTAVARLGAPVASVPATPVVRHAPLNLTHRDMISGCLSVGRRCCFSDLASSSFCGQCYSPRAF